MAPDEKPLPDWNDDAALAAWLMPLLPKPQRDWLVMPPHEFLAPFTGEHRQREAIEAAWQGNFNLLAWLLDPPNQHGRPERLSAEAEKLIADRLRGNFKAAKRRPKLTEAQRHASHAAYDDAAARVLKIQDLFKQYFPQRRGHRARAMDIAAHIAGIDPDRLANHRTFKKSRRHK